jgi:tRNA(fMet)-specific endonuclease VapC
MYLLDTDSMTLLERGGSEGARLKARLATIPPDDLATTIISYEEQMRGWLSVSAQARTQEAQIAAYRRLKTHLQIYSNIAVVDYEEKAATEFTRLRQAKIRIGTMDLKIAAIALSNDATLLTRNLSDFSKVPNLKAEDWSV